MERLGGMNSRSGAALTCVPWPSGPSHFRDCSSEAVEVLSMGGQMGMAQPYGLQSPERNSVRQPRTGGASVSSRSVVPSNWQVSPNMELFARSPIQAGNSLGTISRGIDSRMNDGFAYYLDRGNGQLTRLIPADVLPPLNEIPAREPEALGMVVLPPLRAGPPKGSAEMNHPVTIKAVQQHALRQAPDSVQKHIDRIVATSPSAAKKTKIYCDKWIHEGVCAFTQQGCKYKHEMPFDEATQHSLGLFQGFPSWWKKGQEDMKRLSGSESLLSEGMRLANSIGNSAAKDQMWQNSQLVKTSGAITPPTRPEGKPLDSSRTEFTNAPVAPFIWGPIGPPRKAPSGSGSWGNGSGSKGFERNGVSLGFSTQDLVGRRVK
ncbi:hypothetical protein PT974_11389 [Cladobotryum mycophilum]|uniref:C3H1-type domain-containing protein n=1 Tax=Cladobotryum mycophilum TaxID=491253 RepID=A0ABR0S533_9HYPO